jgi:hypothetical protein
MKELTKSDLIAINDLINAHLDAITTDLRLAERTHDEPMIDRFIMLIREWSIICNKVSRLMGDANEPIHNR